MSININKSKFKIALIVLAVLNILCLVAFIIIWIAKGISGNWCRYVIFVNVIVVAASLLIGGIIKVEEKK